MLRDGAPYELKITSVNDPPGLHNHRQSQVVSASNGAVQSMMDESREPRSMECAEVALESDPMIYAEETTGQRPATLGGKKLHSARRVAVIPTPPPYLRLPPESGADGPRAGNTTTQLGRPSTSRKSVITPRCSIHCTRPGYYRQKATGRSQTARRDKKSTLVSA